MKRIIFIIFTMLFAIAPSMAQNRCSYCSGTGAVVKDIEVSHYGVDKRGDKWCAVCGSYKPASHYHVSCSHCGGTGARMDNGYRSGGSSSGVTIRTTGYGDVLNGCLLVYYAGEYGIPILESERNAYEDMLRRDPENAKKFKEWRQSLNGCYINYHHTNCRPGSDYHPFELNNVERAHTNEVNRLNALMKDIWATSSLSQIITRLAQKFDNEYAEYYRRCKQAKAKRDEIFYGPSNTFIYSN